MAPTIFHIREAAIFGSPERLILGQVRHGKAFRYIPVTFRKGGLENAFAAEMTRQGIEYHEVTERFTGDLSTVRRLAKLLREEQPSLIVTHEYKSDFYGRLAARRTGVPHLVHFHGFTAEDARVQVYNKIDIGVMKRVGGIITVSEETRRLLMSKGINGDKVRVVINAVPDEAFETVPFRKPALLPDAPLLVAAGRLSHEKGFDILIDSLALLAKTGHKPSVLIYGDGPERDDLQEQIETHQLTDRVKLMGFTPDVRPPFGAMEFLVVPSRSEGFPLVLLEAWAQGAPVVATPVGGLPDLIDDNVNGILARDATPEALAEALRRALETPDFRDRCGGEGRRRTRERYNFERQLDSLEAIYREFARVTTADHD
jgi:glycosyltransferase involved in cell wall biosynthesis